MLLDFGHIAVFIALGLAIVAVTLVIGKVLRPSHRYPEKLLPYECGEDVIGTPWVKFNIRFYIFALLFLIFEVEVALIFPVMMIFKNWVMQGEGAIAVFCEILLFIAILTLALAYAWSKGDLTWAKSLSSNSRESK